MGKKTIDKGSPQAQVRKLMKSGKVKKKCCKSKPRCKRCPVRALQKYQTDLRKAA